MLVSPSTIIDLRFRECSHIYCHLRCSNCLWICATLFSPSPSTAFASIANHQHLDLLQLQSTVFSSIRILFDGSTSCNCFSPYTAFQFPSTVLASTVIYCHFNSVSGVNFATIKLAWRKIGSTSLFTARSCIRVPKSRYNHFFSSFSVNWELGTCIGIYYWLAFYLPSSTSRRGPYADRKPSWWCRFYR